MIRERIREWLGIQDLVHNQQMLLQESAHIHRRITMLSQEFNTFGPGIARIIAKLDAKYAESEFSPERRAESDRITEENIRRLRAEAAARAPYNMERDDG